MTMHPTSRPSTFPSVAGVILWLLNLATRLLARALNMPEPLVHSTGVFVFAQVAAVENSVGRTLCPIRLWRQFQNWRRKSALRRGPEGPRSQSRPESISPKPGPVQHRKNNESDG
jgi:hypothetical protein